MQHHTDQVIEKVANMETHGFIKYAFTFFVIPFLLKKNKHIHKVITAIEKHMFLTLLSFLQCFRK